ncbi:MAG TPA: hypothetical protein P5567_10230 [Kiritimatiellia bacterium]|nr:hypothetical protein [Kiritimatiellia bacterium]HRZ12815.1 hypothetical protein [Kiritimatiellia bacterium]HSA18233.1 hypothetical protein [Kiritimatiellia bacterium]
MGGMVYASRAYGDGRILFGPGCTISLDMDTGFMDAGSRVGFSVIGTGDSRTYGDISVYFTGGGANDIVSQGSWYWVTTCDTGIPFDSKGLHVEIDIQETNNFTCRLTPAARTPAPAARTTPSSIISTCCPRRASPTSR